MTKNISKNVAIIGTGNMGSGLASLFDKAGFSVTIGSRDIGRARAVAATLGRGEAASVRAAVESADTIVLAVPMHALSDEQAERFRELPIVQQAGLRVAVWRGRAAEDPDNRGNPMCGDLESVRDAQAIGLSAQTACCKRKIKKPDGTKITVTCPLFGGCAYQAQIEREADLWIMASDLLWHEKPSAMGEIAAVVVDESAWRKGLLGAEGVSPAMLTDPLIAFALGMFTLQRVEMYLRARRLLDEARSRA